MKNILRNALLASSLVGALLATTSVAQAQTKYYARERIVGMSKDGTPAVTYTPVYGPFSTCTGGSQSASVVSCSGSDGSTRTPSSCSQTPKTQPCTSRTCGAFTTGTFISSRMDIAFFAATSMSEAQPKAKALCEGTNKTGNICGLYSGYGSSTCADAGSPVPTGSSCYGVSIGPKQTLSSPGSASYATASCS